MENVFPGGQGYGTPSPPQNGRARLPGYASGDIEPRVPSPAWVLVVIAVA